MNDLMNKFKNGEIQIHIENTTEETKECIKKVLLLNNIYFSSMLFPCKYIYHGGYDTALGTNYPTKRTIVSTSKFLNRKVEAEVDIFQSSIGKKVKISYTLPSDRGDLCDNIAMGRIENISSNKIWIRNYEDCLECFSFEDIVQMIQIKEK